MSLKELIRSSLLIFQRTHGCLPQYVCLGKDNYKTLNADKPEMGYITITTRTHYTTQIRFECMSGNIIKTLDTHWNDGVAELAAAKKKWNKDRHDFKLKLAKLSKLVYDAETMEEFKRAKTNYNGEATLVMLEGI
jgi:hypothetical protein